MLLAAVPVAGPLLALWAFVPTTAAIRDITGSDTGRAILLNLAGAVAAALTVRFLAPILAGMF